MPAARVDISLLEGALGVQPNNVQGHIAIIAGPAADGPLLTPAAFARPQDVQSNFVSGPLVEYASTVIKNTGKHCIVLRTGDTTVGAYGSVATTNAATTPGTSVVTADAAVEPYDEYEVYIKWITGGTIGVAGITYQWSLDGGRTLSATTALGTAATLTLASGNVKLDFAAGTRVAGDVTTCRTSAPAESNTDFSDAMTAIGECGMSWDFASFATPMSAAQCGTVDTWLSALWAKGIHKAARLTARGPAVGETEAQYLASLTSDFNGFLTQRMTVSAGYAEFASGVSGRLYRQPISRITTCRALSSKVKPWLNDLGQVDLGPVSNDCKIRDASGNRKAGLHDEALDPGLDTLGFETLTTLQGYGLSAYVTTPKTMARVGATDYYLWQYVAVVNRASDAAQTYLIARCRKPIYVDPKTGYITDKEARAINRGVEAAVRNAVGGAVSAQSFAVGRTDNLLAQNAFVTGDLRIIPLAYPAGFSITLGFENPAIGIPA